MKSTTITLFVGVAGLAACGASAQQTRSTRVVTSPTGTWLVESARTARTPIPYVFGPGIDGGTWFHSEGVAIPESVSLSQAAASAWVGEALNQERMQRFALPGTGIPVVEFRMGADSPSKVSAAGGADLAVILDKSGGPFTVRAFSSASGVELWNYPIKGNYNAVDSKPVKVSRDGSVVVAFATDTNAQLCELFILDGPTGAYLRSWVFTGFGGSVDLTDNGGLALVAQSANGRVIDTATGVEVFSAAANGAGGRFNISGDGSIIVLGGFDLRVHRKQGATWVPAFTYFAPNSWFGWGSAVSRDNSTIGVMSHDYAQNYLVTATRVFDVPTGALLGTHNTTGAGQFQDSIAGAAISDDGSVLAVASWGAQNNVHPEVMVFDRAANLIDSIDTPGSPFGFDMTGNGRYILVGSKAVHANIMGNGGRVTLLDRGESCYPDCNDSGTLTVADFGCFQDRYVLGNLYSDCNASGTLTVADFGCFQGKYVLGCP
ncbi:MAG: hypothetical protein ACKVU4_01115 [Phycisphaerales bacterium]